MAEIKSTLDIIMEKAEKYKVTEEEKRVFKRRELEGRIKGLIQKYLDGILDSERLKEEVEAMEEKGRQEAAEIMRAQVLGRIRPGEGNGPLPDILSTLEANTDSVKALLQQYEKRIAEEQEGFRKGALEALRAKGISGSAVVLNLEAHKERREVVAEAESAFREQLRSLP